MSRLLMDEKPLLVQPRLATAIGLNESIVLQQIHYWIEINKQSGQNFVDGRFWVYNTISDWQQNDFPFFSESTLKRIIKNLHDKKIILKANYNAMKIDRTVWYSIDYDVLVEIEKVFFDNKTKDESELPLVQIEPNVKVTLNQPITREYQRINTTTTKKQKRSGGGASSSNPKKPKAKEKTKTNAATESKVEKETTPKQQDQNDLVANNHDMINNKDFSEIVKIYESNVGYMTPFEYEVIGGYFDELGKDMVIESIRIATLANKRSMRYIEGILKKWLRNGYKCVGDIKKSANDTTEDPIHEIQQSRQSLTDIDKQLIIQQQEQQESAVEEPLTSIDTSNFTALLQKLKEGSK